MLKSNIKSLVVLQALLIIILSKHSSHVNAFGNLMGEFFNDLRFGNYFLSAIEIVFIN